MSTALEIVFTHRWWEWPDNPSAFDYMYRGLNLIEGTVWLILAVLVLRRYLKQRRSRIELLYAATFALFGLTDFIESRVLTSWLIWFKGFVLAALLVLRYIVIRRFYPASKTY